jgi:hypothetical protein
MSNEANIQFIPARAMPGTVRKRLSVPEGQRALLVEGQEVTGQRGAGEYTLGNWPRPAPEAVLLPQGPFDLHPRILNLQSADGQAFDLAWPLTVQIEDALRFYSSRLAGAPDPSLALADLEDSLAGLLWDRAQEEALAYGLEDLDGEAQVQAALGRAMRPQLTARLAELGLKLVGSQHPEPRTLDEERAALETLSQAARAARDARFDALFERLEDRQMLADRLVEWFADQGQAPPDEALVDLLWEEVDQGPEETALRARRAAQALERQVTSLRITLQSERTQNERRFGQLMARLEKAEVQAVPAQAAAVDLARALKRVLWILRVLGTGLTLAAGLVALLAPQLDQEYDRIQILALLLTVVIGLLTLASDLWLQNRVVQLQRRTARAKEDESKASLRRRREADRLVRSRVESGLQQVVQNLEAAWKKGYSAGGAARDLAVKVRNVALEIKDRDEKDVRVANYNAGRYLAQQRVPDEHLAAVLDQDEDLLQRSRSLADMAEGLYEQVNAGQVDEARAALRDLENGLNSLRNRFTERGAYLMEP